jgi:cyclic-di-AMP phosphodiesterase PgpH
MFFRREKQRMRRTLESRWLRSFFYDSLTVRWGIFLLTVAALVALATIGSNPEPLDLTVGQISPRRIEARVNFTYYDEAATAQEGSRRAQNAPNFYKVSTDSFERSMARVRTLFERINAGRINGGKVSESKSHQISDLWNEAATVKLEPADIQHLAIASRKKEFFESLEQIVNRIVRKGIKDDQFTNQETPIAFPSPSGNFAQVQVMSAGQFPGTTEGRKKVTDQLLSAIYVPKSALKSVEKVVSELVVPNLQLNMELSRKYQEHVKKEADKIYPNVSKGEVMVERGDLVNESKLAMLKAHDAEVRRQYSKDSKWQLRLGTAGVILLLVAITALVLAMHQPHPMSNREYGLMASIAVLHFAICRLTMYIMAHYTTLAPSLLFSILPLCLGPMLVAILLHRTQAIFVTLVMSFMMGTITNFSFPVMVISLLSGLIAIYIVSPLRRRARIYEAGMFAGLVAATGYIVFGFMWNISAQTIGFQGICAIAAALGASILVSALLPLLELLFKVTTDLRWLEMADLNHPLLKRMVMEAPGTYHHSLVVANLSERACESIGAHALQARVCSYFHDIGKLSKPEYFCENQVGIENPHDDIAPNMSALIIISHVKDGVDLAIQHRLARPIIDSIQQHHGTSQVTYFYRLAKRNEEEARLGSKIMRMNVSDVPRVEEETYRYPGPKPQTREIAIISLADAVEGASRCLLKPTPQKVEALITEIIEERYRDGQLDESPLSIRELKLVAESFSKTILSMMHTRVSYPKDESDTPQPPSVQAPTTAQSMA